MKQTAAAAPLAILVPVFNERESLGRVLEGLLRVRGESPWDIIVVDDGSTDGSAEIAGGFAGRVRVLRHAVNRGYGAALKSGILATRAENVLLFDSDGQHDPEEIAAFVEALGRNEFVFGGRPPGAGIPTIRKPGKWVLQKVCNFLAGQKIPDINCGFRAGRRRVFLRMLDLLPDGFSFSTTSLLYVLKSAFSYTFVPVRCHVRQGASSVRMLQDGMATLLLSLRLIMLFDPLKAFLPPSLFLVFIGVIYEIYILAATGLHVEGGSIISVLAGIILFHFGLLADQIASLRKEMSTQVGYLEEDRGGTYLNG